jgi:hypothetical protein
MSEKKSAKQETADQGEVRTEGIASAQQPEVKVPESLIYLGPPVSGVAMPGTVYRNGLTPQLEKMKEEIPALGRLLVEVGRVQQVRRELQDSQSAASICYQKVVEHIKKGAER